MDYDVAVVGAGPAGSLAARNCTERGLSTILLEKGDFSSAKVCGGLLPACVLEEFNIPSKAILRKLKGYRVYSPKDDIDEFIFEKKGATTNRDIFDSYLAREAEKAGAELSLNSKVSNVDIGKKNAIITFQKEAEKYKLSCNIVISADGVGSRITKKFLGNVYTKNKFAHLYQVTYPLVNEIDFFEVYVHDTISQGLGWISPKDNVASLGIGVDPSQNAKDVFYTHLNARKSLLSEKINLDEELKVESAPLSYCNFLEKAYYDRLLVVGDAALLTNPASGDGIYYAMKSGEFAANIATKSIEKGDFTEEILKQYQNILESEFRDIFNYNLKVQRRFFRYPHRHEFLIKSKKKAHEFLDSYFWSKHINKVPLKHKIELELAYLALRGTELLTGRVK